MAALITSLFVFAKLLLCFKLTHCEEVDFCVPARAGNHVFRLSAFKQVFHLRLAPDSRFLALRGAADLRQCFFSGTVNADPDSFAALSLCKGLQGGFSYRGAEYFIRHTDTGDAEHRNSVNGTHVIHRRTRAAHPSANHTSRCAVTPDANVNVSAENHKHLDGLAATVLKNLGRSKRFASIHRFVEVLVVADESMAAFHGGDLKHYLMTLMAVAARLYKHPSILNSINIVVVDFMVINQADKGPKISSNAALTLRNFCSWQKKLNKHSDKHPEYWDTAILFTKQVVDGTLCSPDTSAVCVQGRCIKAGCDGKLDSSKKFDKCGVCGGDNRGCKKVSGMFTKPVHGYNFIATLPVGASNIDVRQRGYRGMVSDENYLAVKNRHGKYLLNGNYVVSAAERDLLVKGGLLRYSGTSSSVEVLRSTRPLQEALTVEVLSVGKMTPPRVRYSFYIAKETKEDKTLRKEEQSRVAHNSALADSNRVEAKEPPLGKRPVSRWVTGGWDSCTASCGSGLQTRSVRCQSTKGRPAADCGSSDRPASARPCGDPCPAWDAGGWSQCSKSCGRGFKRRAVRCVTGDGPSLPRSRCSGRRKPQELDLCNLKPC